MKSVKWLRNELGEEVDFDNMRWPYRILAYSIFALFGYAYYLLTLDAIANEYDFITYNYSIFITYIIIFIMFYFGYRANLFIFSPIMDVMVIYFLAIGLPNIVLFFDVRFGYSMGELIKFHEYFIWGDDLIRSKGITFNNISVSQQFVAGLCIQASVCSLLLSVAVSRRIRDIFLKRDIPIKGVLFCLQLFVAFTVFAHLFISDPDKIIDGKPLTDVNFSEIAYDDKKFLGAFVFLFTTGIPLTFMFFLSSLIAMFRYYIHKFKHRKLSINND